MSKRCMGCMELYGDEFEICPQCGYVEGTAPEEAIHMEPGVILNNRYVIGKVLGYGGFGVTYIGWDGKLEQKVAIKEYLPSEFSTRMPGQSMVTVFNGDRSEQFIDGMNKFIDEARRLAKFQNEPGIVRVFDSFNENGTAYIIMEYLEGETLTERLKRDKTIPEDEAVNMLLPVMQSLKVVHQEGILHRDIAPDNIFLTKNGEVKLIDFGASRYATTSHSRSLSVIIKPGYSPEEQYRSRGDQGPHSDVYALAATLYKMITGKTPPDAMERRAKIESKKKELLEAPSKLVKNVSVNRENAILNAMNVRIEDRTPDVDTFMAELNANPPAKRRYGKIKKIDVYSWPLWLKILLPSIATVILVFGVLLATGVIKFQSLFTDEVIIPEGMAVVPDVEGKNREDAFAEIEKAELNASGGGTIISDYVEAGLIILQNPVGGTVLKKNSVVTLKICVGNGEVVEAKNGISTVPYIEWETEEDAINKLKQAGLGEPNIEYEYDDNIAEGHVISQSREPGEEIPEGEVITIVISKGPAPFAMPNVVGMTREVAESTLLEKGLSVTVEYGVTDKAEIGNVYEQSIPSGSNARKGDSIVIKVCSKKATIQVANVVGMTSSDASTTLKKQGFQVSIVENPSATVAKGVVISQSPDPGTTQAEGTIITLVVSSGVKTVNVPNLSGSNLTGATQLLEAQGLVLSGATEEYSDTIPEGVVISQSPAAGTSVKSGSGVSIVISKGPHTVTVSFNANGGTLSGSSSIQAKVGGTYSGLPSAQMDYFNFDGWFTAASGGTKVSDGSAVISDSPHTLYAHWSQKAEVDWVKESELPEGAQVTATKWTYKLTSYTTSDQSSLPGWTQYDVKSAWGEWGAWSGWQDEAVGGSDSRQVESEQYPVNYFMEEYTMTDYDSPSYRGYYSYRPSGTMRYHPTANWTPEEFASARAYSPGTYFKDGGSNVYGMIRGNGNAYYLPQYEIPLYNTRIDYGTHYRYRDRSLIYTYYYTKTESREAESDPTGGEGVSDVEKYVKYIPK